MSRLQDVYDQNMISKNVKRMVKGLELKLFGEDHEFEPEQCSPKSLVPPNNGVILKFQTT